MELPPISFGYIILYFFFQSSCIPCKLIQINLTNKGLVKKYRGEGGGCSREGVGHQFLNPW